MISEGRTLQYIPMRSERTGVRAEHADNTGNYVRGRAARLRKIREDRRRRQRITRIRICSVMAFLALTMFMTLSGFSSPELKDYGSKCYRPVVAESGDTLWSIASGNLTGDYTVKSLIREIEELNQIGPAIQYGQLIMVPYYTKTPDEGGI